MGVARVEWQELRGEGVRKELFFVIADKAEGDKWEFFERTSWDVEWKLVPESKALMARLGREQKKLEQQRQQTPKPPAKELRSRMDAGINAVRQAHERMAKAALNRAMNRPKQRN